MSDSKARLYDILDRATAEVNTWPDWLRSDENRSERERLERQRGKRGERNIADDASR
jgi:hypothetical protein